MPLSESDIVTGYPNVEYDPAHRSAVSTNAEPTTGPDSNAGSGPDAASQRDRFDGPWLRILTASTGVWVVLYMLDWALLEAGTPAGAAVGFAHAYLLAPLVAATILLDSLSLNERGTVDLGLFKWAYTLVALVFPPVSGVYYAHREWLQPGDPDLLGGP